MKIHDNLSLEQIDRLRIKKLSEWGIATIAKDNTLREVLEGEIERLDDAYTNRISL